MQCLWRTSYRGLRVEAGRPDEGDIESCFGQVRFEWTFSYLRFLIYQNVNEIF